MFPEMRDRIVLSFFQNKPSRVLSMAKGTFFDFEKEKHAHFVRILGTNCERNVHILQLFLFLAKTAFDK